MQIITSVQENALECPHCGARKNILKFVPILTRANIMDIPYDHALHFDPEPYRALQTISCAHCQRLLREEEKNRKDCPELFAQSSASEEMQEENKQKNIDFYGILLIVKVLWNKMFPFLHKHKVLNKQKEQLMHKKTTPSEESSLLTPCSHCGSMQRTIKREPILKRNYTFSCALDETPRSAVINCYCTNCGTLLSSEIKPWLESQEDNSCSEREKDEKLLRLQSA